MSPAISTDITREYTAMIPAMTTGMSDLKSVSTGHILLCLMRYSEYLHD